MYLEGPRERFCEPEGEDARGRLYAMVRTADVEVVRRQEH
jgi:hypothetical protein